MEQERESRNTDRATQTSETANRSSLLVGVGLAVVLASAAFFSGLHLGSAQGQGASIDSLFSSTDRAADVDLDRFWHVWNVLEERFVASTTTDPVSAQARIDGAIEGLVEAYGDPYTVYFPPKESQMFEDEISGNFEGVGMEIGERDDILTVIAPLPDTPAERAGIRSGDMIIRIDGVSTENLTIDEAVERIRGEKGTEVVLTILRDGEDEVREISVVRDTIDIPTSKTFIRDGVFVVQLYNFSALSEANMQAALREFVRSGQRKLIIDLRGNPGGFLQSAVNIASYFLPTGKAVVREHFGDTIEDRVHRSSGRTLGAYAPESVVVLVDGGSASASEILAGALQEHGVAPLIGMQTFGKGSVQELVDLDGGSSLKVTIARWLTPNGVSISDNGLTPDIEVPYEVTDEEREAGVDPQMDAAIEYLNR